MSLKLNEPQQIQKGKKEVPAIFAAVSFNHYNGPYGIGTITIPISQMRKLGLREPQAWVMGSRVELQVASLLCKLMRVFYEWEIWQCDHSLLLSSLCPGAPLDYFPTVLAAYFLTPLLTLLLLLLLPKQDHRQGPALVLLPLASPPAQKSFDFHPAGLPSNPVSVSLDHCFPNGGIHLPHPQ